MQLNYDDLTGKLNGVVLHQVQDVTITDCRDHKGISEGFVSIDLYGRRRENDHKRTTLTGYLTVEAARDLRNLLNDMEL